MFLSTSRVSVARATTLEQVAACLTIRHQVFVVEQGVPIELERDVLDEQAIHMLACVGDRSVGTARVLVRTDASAKVGRVAVLKDARGIGIGRQIMIAIADEPALSYVTRFELHAQIQASKFYEGLGYRVAGAPFVEAGLPHVAMHFDRLVLPGPDRKE